MDIESLLRDWAAAIAREIESTSLPSETTIFKMMKCGIRADGGIIPIPNYWPKPHLVKVNDAIWSLPIEDRNIIVGKRVLCYNWREVGELIGITSWGARKRMEKAEQKLINMLR